MSNDLKWMLSSDQQIPFQDDRAVALWFKVMKAWKPDVVDYLGDTSDQFCYSRFDEGRSAEFLNSIKKEPNEALLPFVIAQEKDTKAFYEKTRSMLPNAEMFVALGNHDIRVWDYLDKKARDILDQVTPESLWGLDSLGYNYIFYGDKPQRRYGDIYVHHGISISQHAGESARKDVESLGVSLIRGHSHRLGTYHKTYELRGETLRGYEIGHMSDEKSEGMGYTNIHNWQKSFAIAHIESGVAGTVDGYYPHIQIVEISKDYTCYVDGKKFSA